MDVSPFLGDGQVPEVSVYIMRGVLVAVLYTEVSQYHTCCLSSKLSQTGAKKKERKKNLLNLNFD